MDKKTKTPRDKAWDRYQELFQTGDGAEDVQGKAEAFDEIAERFYMANFGEMQKSDVETLLFSIYIERILDRDEENMEKYSDYTLSKLLGITQSKVSSLKVKKELKYPYKYFDWKKSFNRIVKNASYDNGKIKINIPDRNLYLEIKHAVESHGGYIEMQLNSSLLQVSPVYFLDLMMAVCEKEGCGELIQKIQEELEKRNIDYQGFSKKKNFFEVVKQNKGQLGTTVIAEIISAVVPGVGPIVGNLIKEVSERMEEETK